MRKAKKGSEAPREVLVQFRVSEAEAVRLAAKAKAHGMPIASWARVMVLNFDFNLVRVDDIQGP